MADAVEGTVIDGLDGKSRRLSKQRVLYHMGSQDFCRTINKRIKQICTLGEKKKNSWSPFEKEMVGERELEFGTQAMDTAIVPGKIVRESARVEVMDMRMRTDLRVI